MKILDTIVEQKKEEVAQLKAEGVSRPELPVDPPEGVHAGTSSV